jgi:glyoxylase-like metal-dependent hydrolase (beta-lactamase superfamily II)
MYLNQIEDDLYLFVGDTYHSNSTVFVAQDEVLLIDALASRDDAEKLKAWIEQELKKHVRLIVCTHYFCDHLAALNLFPRAKVVAHRDYLDTFNSELYCSPQEKTHFREPDILISDELRIRWGRRTLDIFHNPGHTPSTLAIDVKSSDLLIVGDTLVGNIVYLAYSTPERFVSALSRLKARARGRLISSHGDVRNGAAINNAQSYLQNLKVRVDEARACTEGEQSLSKVSVESCLPPGIAGTAFEKIYHERNLRIVLERGFFAGAG